LELDASVTATVLDELVGSGLIEPSGHVRAPGAAQNVLNGRPSLRATLSLRLARQLPYRDSFHLWRSARALWEESDHAAVRAAYLYWASESTRRGFPLPAAEALEEAPAN